MRKYFGTDGVRGIANQDLSPELAYKLGRAAGFVLKKYSKQNNKKPKFIIGTDTRISKDLLFSALASGIMSVGCDVVDIGVSPTPVVAFLTKKYKMDAGVVISASHNPMEYNGIKFFNADGLKLNDEIELEIESLIENSEEFNNITFINENIGTLSKEDLKKDYIEYISNLFSADYKGLKVVLDCANGAAYKMAPDIYKNLDIEFVAINNMPDGSNINLNAGSTNIKGLSKAVVESKADIGLAYDGDADRLIAVDENGKEVDGDIIMLLCANYLKQKNKLKDNKLVVTVMSNLGLHLAAGELGISIDTTAVGDRYVLEHMLKKNLSLGGEQSGHMIFSDYNTTGDGILSSLFLVNILKDNNKKLSELTNIMKVYPQVLINAKIKNDKKEFYKTDESIQEEIKKLEKIMSGEGRVLIRPSGTEPLIRVMIEGKNLQEITKYAEQMANLIEKKLG